MSFAIAAAVALFVGPLGFLLSALLVIVLILVVGRLLFGLAWNLLVIGAVVVAAIWLLGATSSGPPGLA